MSTRHSRSLVGVALIAALLVVSAACGANDKAESAQTSTSAGSVTTDTSTSPSVGLCPDLQPIETRECLATELEQIESELSDLEGEFRDYWGQNDPLPEMQEDADRYVASATAAEATWRTYRDQQCDAVGALAAGGSNAPEYVATCKIDLTAQRVEFLRSQLSR